MAIKHTVDEIYNELLTKISRELSDANQNNKLDEFIEKYNLFLDDEDTAYYNELDPKILIVGELSFSSDILYTIAKKEFNISKEKIRLLNYQEAKHFDYQSLKGYSEYTDILIGPNAHKAVGIGEYNSVISMITSEQQNFPKLTLAQDSTGKLKFSKTSLRNALSQTKIAKLMSA